jgi:glycosyltransferase involved in cell wall biosynthesis
VKVGLLTTDNREPFKQYGARTPWFGTAPEALLQGFARMPDLEVHVVSCARKSMESPEKLADNIWFHSLTVPKIGWIRTGYQGCIRAVRQKLRAIGPDIVHGQGTEGDCSISAVYSGFPNVLTIHGNMRLIAQVNQAKVFSHGWLIARLEAFTIPRSLGVVCITRYTQNAVSSLARRTWVLPNAVDASFFDVNPAPPSSGPRNILCVGHVWLRKNQNAFIRALDPLAKKMDFKVIFLGEVTPGREYGAEFLALVKERPWCEHIGFVDREGLKKHLRSASMLALPSLEDNCPMTVLEAMAAGVPVIAAKVGGVPDLIEEGQTGRFCDPLDAASMRDVIEKALADRAGSQAMAARAKAAARQRFHPEVVARRHVEIYREVLSKC